MNQIDKVKFIDLFAGIGGFHQALKAFKAECVFASEWDKDCRKNYAINHNLKPEGDITQIDEKKIPSHDLLCAGFPCQAFSISGKQLGFNDTRGTLFFDIARIAKYHKPKVLLLENVKNFEKHDKGKTLAVVIQTLNEIGYDVFYKVLNASNFGVPQKRERLYITAFRKELLVEHFYFPTSSEKATHLAEFCLPDSETNEFIINRKDVFLKDAIDISTDIFNNYPQKPIRIGIVNKGGQGERIYHEKGHAITLSAYGGGVGAKTGLYQINGKIRKLAPKECARIMGFSDDFTLDENKNITYRQLGNGVVVNVVHAIMENIFQLEFFKSQAIHKKESLPVYA